jgi:hypothetical protein
MDHRRLRLLILLALGLPWFPPARADEAARARILKQREAVLAEILTGREQRFTLGAGDEESVRSARLALWSFRRDTAPSVAERIRQQKLIVGLWEKKLSALENRLVTGLAEREDILLATDSLLQAQVLLEELNAREKGK